MRLDLNCDLGEGEPPARTRALMRHVTSVSVACGGHAGDAGTMERCVLLAKELRVGLGAHPGLTGNFGRAEANLTPADLALLVLQQVGALHRLTEVHRIRLHHVKLHGALYHQVERDDVLARAYVEAIGRWFRGLRLYALAGGRVVAVARELGVPVWEEAFADRAYRADGTLLPRSEPGAVLSGVAAVRRRVRELRAGQGLRSVDATLLPLRPRTLCVHSDTAGAVLLARTVAMELRNVGF